MALKLDFQPYTLKFKFDAGTSRGVLREKETWIVKIHESHHPEVFGLGECGPLKGLSVDDQIEYGPQITRVKDQLWKHQMPASEDEVYELATELVPSVLPALRFAIETALLDLLNDGQRVIFKNRLVASGDRLPINGLVWMGDEQFMRDQIEEKIEAGFSCIKMKVGAIDFDKECELLEGIRKNFGPERIVLRLDANGAFKTNEALGKLKRLAAFDLHSIEQPIMPRQPEAMQMMCKLGKVSVALDEELIGIHDESEMRTLLNFIAPQFIILKPTLLGGLHQTRRWISIAEELKIGWWLTSALESNIGLNAITQFTANYHIDQPQGLGTGQLFTNNFDSPLSIESGEIFYDRQNDWNLSSLKLDR